MNGTEFGEWLDQRGISVTEAAAYFGVSEKTIYQWRSTGGVPDRKQPWVRDRMAEYGARPFATDQLDRITLEVTRDQFIAWNRAALEEGKILYDWAADVLDREAAADGNGGDATGSGRPSNSLTSLKAAEEGVDYLSKKDQIA